jgi:hypothetical protein
MMDPKAVHVADQLEATFRSHAKAVATYYRELTVGGVPAELAATLVIGYLNTLTQISLPPPTGQS